jgi:DNA polymerase I-like protein with 3'-5' exonuclease and polymerase domains
MGLFWDDEPVKTGRVIYERTPPPVPQTDWKMPEEYPDLSGHGMIAIDVETYDPDLKTRGPGANRDGYIAGVAVGTESGYRQYFPIAHKGFNNLDKQKTLAWLREQISRPGQPKVGAKLIYDLEFLEAAGVKVVGPFYDVQVADPLLDETKMSYSLEHIARDWLGEGKRDEVMERWLTLAYGKDNIKSNIYRAPPQVVGPYAESDVDLPLRIFAKQKIELEREGLWDLFMLESRLIPLLLAMRQRGVPVDTAHAERLKKLMQEREDKALAEIKRQTGIEPDIWAADSIAKLFDEAGMNYPRTEKTNKPSFRKGWLEQQQWPIAKMLVEARAMSKFRGTFIEGYILNGSHNERIHCEFHQLRGEDGGTVSGRFASSGPNLQNLPIRHPELGATIRDAFVAEPGQSWWKMDWSQIEFRLAVHFAAMLNLSGSEEVVEQYRTDPTTDYHKVTATLTGLPRSQAKSINFGLVYGMGETELCRQLGVDRDQGQIILSQYHRKVPFIRPLYNTAMRRAEDRACITTLLGRKRRFNVWEKGMTFVKDVVLREQTGEEDYRPEFDGWKRAFTHKALNSLLQGSAADIMKQAMVKTWEDGLFEPGVLGAPHLTVHDELDGSMEDSAAAREALAEVKNTMETCVSLVIPMIVDQGFAKSWGKTKN